MQSDLKLNRAFIIVAYIYVSQNMTYYQCFYEQVIFLLYLMRVYMHNFAGIPDQYLPKYYFPILKYLLKLSRNLLI